MSLAGKPIDTIAQGILRDPQTHAALRLEGDHFVSTTNRYPIINGIPRFVGSDHYVGSFSFEWNTHDTTQLDRASGSSSESERQFVAKTGFSPKELAGKLVLDAGVGAGRFAEIASRWGAQLVGVDLSFAVEAAHRNLLDRPNVFIAQADIGRLPFDEATFDFIFSIGVLHHTPDTQRYFLGLVPLLKPGGSIAIWVYPPEHDYLIRERWVRFVNRIPPRAFHAWCRWFVPWAQTRLANPWVDMLRRLFPFSTQGPGLEHKILETFDGYSPRYHGLHSPEEVEGWFREAGLVDIHRPSDWNSCVRGRRPDAG